MFEDRGFQRVVATMGWTAMAVLVFPVILTIVVSFSGSQFIEFPPKSFSMDWYANIAKINKIGEATLLSLLVASLTGIFTVAMAIPAALAIARHGFPAKAMIVAFLLSPVAVPMIAIGIAILQFFVWTGLPFNWITLLVGHVVLTSAYPVRTIVASLTLSNPSLEEAAASLGASRWTVFRTVTLPQLTPGLISGFLFAFLISFDNYPISIFLVRSGVTTMPIEVFNYISQQLDPTPAAFSTIYIVIVSAIIVLVERRFGVISLSVRG
ncbi:MAG: ABC transporter permease [Rhodospirillaceae bacterium]|nr:ABC transporter permease [Rhodospirillaceae bacterium]MCY4066085.1 ABC transporter permease [Rhodospirillaceae bacterium]